MLLLKLLSFRGSLSIAYNSTFADLMNNVVLYYKKLFNNVHS